MNIIKKSNAKYFLFINAGLWGSTYVWSKMLLEYLPHLWILFINSVGGTVLTSILFRPSVKQIQYRSIIKSSLISILSVISNIFFIFALQYTSSSNVAF